MFSKLRYYLNWQDEYSKRKGRKLISIAIFKKQVSKTLPYFEKAQACDPDERTLAMITNLYNSVKDAQSLSTFDSRLKTLGESCVSLLDDE
jgi:hypothetical protein